MCVTLGWGHKAYLLKEDPVVGCLGVEAFNHTVECEELPTSAELKCGGGGEGEERRPKLPEATSLRRRGRRKRQ